MEYENDLELCEYNPISIEYQNEIQVLAAIVEKPAMSFFEKLMKIKEISIQFNKFNKIAISQSIPSDELLSQLEKKLNIDSEILAPLVNDIKDINQLTKNIMKTEKEIYQAINYIKIQLFYA